MPLLPTIQLGPHRVTRLICGGNPIAGFSHTSAEMDREMRRYYTMANVQALFNRCVACGINTIQTRGDRFHMRAFLEHRDAGGSLQWIAQTASEFASIPANIREIAAYGPIAVYHHGTHVDNLWHAGRIDEVAEILKAIRDTGVVTGMGSHIPEVIEYAESRGWPTDFYLCSLYNLAPARKTVAAVEGVDPDERFHDADRDRMTQVIRQLDKPVLAIKPLAAGRNAASADTVRDAFAYAYGHIKPTDAVVAGMFQKHKDQVAENTRIVRDLLDRPT